MNYKEERKSITAITNTATQHFRNAGWTRPQSTSYEKEKISQCLHPLCVFCSQSDFDQVYGHTTGSEDFTKRITLNMKSFNCKLIISERGQTFNISLNWCTLSLSLSLSLSLCPFLSQITWVTMHIPQKRRK
jgi:hypothetical protein